MEQEGSSIGLDSEDVGLESGIETLGDDNKKDAAVKSSIDLATNKNVKANVKTTAPKTTTPSEKEKQKEKEEQSVADKAGEKIQDKVTDVLKEKVQDKAKDALGDPAKGKEELADRVIDAVNQTNAKRAARVTAGQKASQVSTTVAANANVAPLIVSHPNAAVATNIAPQAPPQAAQAAASSSGNRAAQKIASGAGRGTPPASAVPTTSAAGKGSQMLDELMTYGKDLSSAVFKGAKESKNIRMLGLAALAGATGWAVGKNKDAKQTQKQEFNRQQAIRQSLMSDG